LRRLDFVIRAGSFINIDDKILNNNNSFNPMQLDLVVPGSARHHLRQLNSTNRRQFVSLLERRTLRGQERKLQIQMHPSKQDKDSSASRGNKGSIIVV
jgi:hypothetical protein